MCNVICNADIMLLLINVTYLPLFFSDVNRKVIGIIGQQQAIRFNGTQNKPNV